MSKIQRIEITNFKAITDFTADFKGCTAIVTAGNNKGKSSLLRGIPDRVRFIRPDIMVKEGATQGKGEMTLTTGEKFVWNFNKDGKDTLQYISDKGIKSSVTKDLGAQFFPPTFDIDKFMQAGPKDQAKQLQGLIGVDFTDIDSRYSMEYANRTAANKESDRLQAKLDAIVKPENVTSVDLTELAERKEAEKKRLNDLYIKNKEYNESLRTGHTASVNKSIEETDEHNKAQDLLAERWNAIADLLSKLNNYGYKGNEVKEFLYSHTKPEDEHRQYPAIVAPEYIPEMPDRSALDAIDAQIMEASTTNQKAQSYTDYMKLVNEVGEAKELATQKDTVVKAIEAERKTLIEGAKFPQGITITPDGIMVDGLPLDKNQLSTSKLYTTALRIASMNLGEVKTLYFDASFLDRNSLSEIEEWAQINDLQLLIERPDFDGGEIKYELIEN